MSFWDSATNFVSDSFESISEGASDWVENVIDTQLKETGARPETNEKKGENVVFGDGKEKPTVTAVPTGSAPIISGVDNKNLLLGGLGLVAVLLLVKG